MSDQLASAVREICEAAGKDRHRMMDIVEAVQAQFQCVSPEAIDLIAEQVGCHRVEVEGVVSFYAFLTEKPTGKVVIRLCNDVIDMLKGQQAVADAFVEALGIDFGQTTDDGMITLEWAPCIGMSDQAPAALINAEVVTYLSADMARNIVAKLRENPDPKSLIGRLGDGKNADDLVRSMVHNNIRNSGEVLLRDDITDSAGLKKALDQTPAEVIREVKTSRLRGRGGAGFPTGMKWEFTRAAKGDQKYVICNADEGEPGTFKDRVLLTEKADLLFEGMTIGGWAVGSDCGILYLRGEYAYLREYLEAVLARRRENNLLGKDILGKGFDFDIRIQMGAGAYICGEETALISSCEGLRGDPKNRPPFPAQKGYLGCPTTVNNVETLCKVARILDEGAGWFAGIGTEGSAGTKLLSISGDCSKPGVYEIPFGQTIGEVLELCDGAGALAVQIGGPSGQLIGQDSFDQPVCFDHLATGGSVMIFNDKRDPVKIAETFVEFFEDESCGYCTPCRVGNQILLRKMRAILAGKGVAEDLDLMEDLGATMKTASRCGLGQTAANPVLTSLKNFRGAYEEKLTQPAPGQRAEFDLKAALAPAEAVAGRESVHAKA
jgi:[NiFe] hydrogenase diaphorase moiety large subunit